MKKNYTKVKLGDVVEILDNQRKPITAKDRSAGIYPYYGANGVLDYVKDYIFDEELVLLAEDGGFFDDPSRGVAYRVSGKCWVNNHAHVLKAKPIIDIDYLGYVLRNYNVKPFVSGAVVKKLNQSAIREFTIPLPPLHDQHEIIEKLDQANSLIQKRKESINLLDKYLRSVFLDMFGDPVTNPKGWEELPLDQICLEIYRYPTFYGFDYINKGVPVIKIGNILKNGKIDCDLQNYSFISTEVSNKYPRTIIKLNDILMAVRGDGSTVKRIGIVESDKLVGANMSPNLLRFETDNEIILSKFLFHFMTSPFGQKRFEQYITQTAKKTITARDIKQIKIPIPPIQQQKRYVDIYNTITEIVKTMEQQKNNFSSQFNSLMKKYFNEN